MVTYNTAFEQRQYMAIALKAAKFYLEKAAMMALPLKKTQIPHVKKYRWTRLTKPYIAAEDTEANVATGSHEAEEWSEDGPLADIQHGFNDYDLGSVSMYLSTKKSNIPQFVGSNLLADKREAKIEKFALDVDTGMIRGFYDRTGKVKVASGYQDQATTVTNLNGTDSNLETKGDIWKALVKMIETIPLGMRQSSPPMELVISEHLLAMATHPDRVYLNEIEWDYIKRYLMGDRAEEARRINPNVKISNKLLVAGTDTIVTNDRMALYV
ncbi:hypothetical protein LCGC14_1244390, partial [marine sediment metagenome]